MDRFKQRLSVKGHNNRIVLGATNKQMYIYETLKMTNIYNAVGRQANTRFSTREREGGAGRQAGKQTGRQRHRHRVRKRQRQTETDRDRESMESLTTWIIYVFTCVVFNGSEIDVRPK